MMIIFCLRKNLTILRHYFHSYLFLSLFFQKSNKITTVCAPLEPEIVKSLIRCEPSAHVWLDGYERTKLLEEKFSWDDISSRAVMAVGPVALGNKEDIGTNILQDWTLPDSVSDLSLKDEMMGYIAQGFQWVTREGPLIEESIRNTKVSKNVCSIIIRMNTRDTVVCVFVI